MRNVRSSCHDQKSIDRIKINAYVNTSVLSSCARVVDFITADFNRVTHVRSLPIVQSLKIAWAYLRDYMNKLDVCPNFISHRRAFCTLCLSSSEDGVVSSTGGKQLTFAGCN